MFMRIRKSSAAGGHQLGLGNGTSSRVSTWPSRNATFAVPPRWRKCVAGVGDSPGTIGRGDAMESDSCASGGSSHAAIRAESEKRNVVDVDSMSAKRRVKGIGVDQSDQSQYVVPSSRL